MGLLITQEEVPGPSVEQILPVIEVIDESVEMIPRSVDALQVGLQSFAADKEISQERMLECFMGRIGCASVADH